MGQKLFEGKLRVNLEKWEAKMDGRETIIPQVEIELNCEIMEEVLSSSNRVAVSMRMGVRKLF